MIYEATAKNSTKYLVQGLNSGTKKTQTVTKTRPDKTWTGQNLDRTKPGQDKTWTGQNLDRTKPGQDKTWT